MKRIAWAAGFLLAAGLIFGGLVLESAPVEAQAGHTIVWEAENYSEISRPFVRRTAQLRDKRPRPQTNSGSGYIEIPDGANDEFRGRAEMPGVVRYRVNVPAAGQYQLWARALWPNGCGNSFYVRVQGRPKQVLGEDGTYDVWDWKRLRGPRLTLQRGVNVIEVLNREDGVLMDQIFLTTTNRVPTGAERPTPNAIAQ